MLRRLPKTFKIFAKIQTTWTFYGQTSVILAKHWVGLSKLYSMIVSFTKQMYSKTGPKLTAQMRFSSIIRTSISCSSRCLLSKARRQKFVAPLSWNKNPNRRDTGKSSNIFVYVRDFLVLLLMCFSAYSNSTPTAMSLSIFLRVQTDSLM